MTNLQAAFSATGLVIALVFALWRMFAYYDDKNAKAHKAIGENIQGVKADIQAVDERAERRAAEIKAEIKADVQAVDERAERRAAEIKADVQAIAGSVQSMEREVSILVGRQAERDRSAPAPPPGAPDQ